MAMDVAEALRPVGGVGVLDMLALDEALNKLAELDTRQEQLVELRFFAGMNVEETAEILGVSPRTVARNWRVAKAWLRRELDGEPVDED